MVNIQKASTWSPWIPCFKIKDASIVTSEDKIKIISVKYINFFLFSKKNPGRSITGKQKRSHLTGIFNVANKNKASRCSGFRLFFDGEQIISGYGYTLSTGKVLNGVAIIIFISCDTFWLHSQGHPRTCKHIKLFWFLICLVSIFLHLNPKFAKYWPGILKLLP